MVNLRKLTHMLSYIILSNYLKLVTQLFWIIILYTKKVSFNFWGFLPDRK